MNLKRILLSVIACALFFGTSFAQTARVQVIHNSGDAAAATVDVWLTAGMAAPT